MLVSSGKTTSVDQKFDSDVENSKFENYLFTRVVAKGRKFSKVSFRYSVFDGSYLRDCFFDSCDFTGCKFVGSSLHGSKFSGSKFDYATFERTIIDSTVLDTECPGHENLKLKFARTLRMNYQQLGDVDAVNKAILIELQATELHLHKAWESTEAYYRKKYVGWERAKSFLKWLTFRVLELSWGNGESTWKLLRTVSLVLGVIAISDLALRDESLSAAIFWDSVLIAPQIFFGVKAPIYFNGFALTTIHIVRLILFGFFMSIIIKRFNRR